jgi:DUF4097 and DUF4098 domain-containing protein YvlB
MKNTALFLSFVLLSVAASADVSETIEKSFPLALDGSIDLSNVNGSVDILAWDKAELAMTAVKKAPNEDQLKEIDVVTDASDKHISIETRYPRKLFNNNKGSVAYTLHVPASCKVSKISCVNGGVSVKGVSGKIEIDTVNGSITQVGGSQSMRLHTVNGSIHASPSAPGKDASIGIDTVNGNVTLSLPEGTGAKIEAETINGHIRCGFPITLENSSKHRIEGTIGAGGAKIKVHTVNGNLTIEKP